MNIKQCVSLPGQWLLRHLTSRGRCIALSDLLCFTILTTLVLFTVWICVSATMDASDHSMWFWKAVLLFARLFVTIAFYVLWGVVCATLTLS